MSEKDFDNIPTIRVEVSVYENKNQSWLARHIAQLLLGAVLLQIIVFFVTAVMLLVANVDVVFITNIVGIAVGIIMIVAGYQEKDYYPYYGMNYIGGIIILLLNVVALII